MGWWVGWWVGWWLRFLLILRLSQPSLAGVGAGAELGNTNINKLSSSCLQAYLLNIPGWDWRRDDQAVCLNEVKYGLLAQVRNHLFFPSIPVFIF